MNGDGKKGRDADRRGAESMPWMAHLAGGVAHGYNNLLFVIQGHATRLETRLAPDHPLFDAARQIREAAERAAFLTSHLQALSRGEKPTPRDVLPAAVLQDTGKLLQRILGEDLEVSAGVEAELPPARLDPGELQKLIVVLALRARQALPQGGTLALVAVAPADGGRTRISLSATGRGDGASTAFERSPEDRGDDEVDETLERWETHLELEALPEGGQRASFSLPAIDSAAAEPPPPPVGTESILVVEDDAGVRSLAAIMLQEFGYAVTEAQGGASALAKIESGASFDLLLTDVVMPGMNGRELADRARALRHELPILFTSGRVRREDVLDPEAPSRSAFLAKPFTAGALGRAVRGLLDAVPPA
ncbi:MAG: response regulator [Planctomycetota bacterium]|jgi:CheY-like chemotaxis protein